MKTIKQRISAIALTALMTTVLAVPSKADEFASENDASTYSSTTYTYSIGCDDGTDDFTPNVVYSRKIFNNMSSVSYAYSNTAPSYDYIKGNNPGGYSRLGSKIVLLTGHAGADRLRLDNGNQLVAIHRDITYTATSGRKYYGLNNINMSNTDLIMFFGCNTASGSANLATQSVSNGATSALGTLHEVVSRTGDGAIWVQKFLDGLYNGKTVLNACYYADNFVPADNGMRTGWHIKGSLYTVVNPSGKSISTAAESQGNLDDIIEKPLNINISNMPYSIENKPLSEYKNEFSALIETIQSINPKFDLSEYHISKRSVCDDNAAGIISMSYYIGDNISTKAGYNFLYENNEVTCVSYQNKSINAAQQISDEAKAQLCETVSNNQIVPFSSEIGDQDKESQYLVYDLDNDKLICIQEHYHFDGEVWHDSYSEDLLT